ncbi:hypothetical protein C5167_004090 [Papaver somniferum]|nr:hypothetical protein C5167_004090 [Papaver somniferum]
MLCCVSLGIFLFFVIAIIKIGFKDQKDLPGDRQFAPWRRWMVKAVTWCFMMDSQLLCFPECCLLIAANLATKSWEVLDGYGCCKKRRNCYYFLNVVSVGKSQHSTERSERD